MMVHLSSPISQSNIKIANNIEQKLMANFAIFCPLEVIRNVAFSSLSNLQVKVGNSLLLHFL